jgi:hypothetical protein
MSQAFIIMQIGNTELDRVCAEAIVPAIKACGLEAQRVDKHNEGGLLKSEIIRFIQESDILVADLTNERQNVYLEIGYAMGVDKFKNLILTAREDHFPDSPNYKKGGPKVHFDLAGYDILRWSNNNLPTFCNELEKRIRRRLLLITKQVSTTFLIWDSDWIAEQRNRAKKENAKLGYSGYMEIRAALHPPKANKTQTELSEAARAAELHSPFGWPIAAYLTKNNARPQPRTDGIFAEIHGVMDKTYDYWAIRRNGDFYFLSSLFEDVRRPGEIFFNTRIVRVTEALLYLMRLYTNFGLDRSSKFSAAVRHGGLRDRILSVAGDRAPLSLPKKCAEDLCDEEVSGSIDEFEVKLVAKVEALLAPLFRLFDFSELEHPIYEDIVNNFIKGKVT